MRDAHLAGSVMHSVLIRYSIRICVTPFRPPQNRPALIWLRFFSFGVMHVSDAKMVYIKRGNEIGGGMTMEHEIIGDNLQMVVVKLSSNEMAYAEAGAMVYMSQSMQMNTKAKGGLLKGLKRTLAGETFFMTEFTPSGDGFVAFAGNAPGKIRPIELKGNEFLVQKDAFLCAENSVDLDIAFTKKLGAGLFGGEGFILEKLSGNGTAFIHACGDFVEMNLAPGEVIKVDTGSVVGFDSTVGYDITRAGNVKSMVFGGEGIFLTTLTGPGHIILQSMTVANLAAALRPFLPSGTSGSSGPRINIGGVKLGV